jgi:tetratricopeptide (TPR) repeat protein
MRAALIATILATALTALTAHADAEASPNSPPPGTAAPDHEPPLIAYANEFREKQLQSNRASQARSEARASQIADTNLRAVTFEMARHPPPPDQECAHTLGATRFAEQYSQLAAIQEELGNYEEVLKASKSALACTPRNASYEASIAAAELSMGHIDEARVAAERGNVLDSENPSIRDVRARLDFIQEHWADATARYRLQVLKPDYPRLADYSRCYLWLAQRRAGVRNPELPPRPAITGEASVKRWPAQILETLQGDLSETELVQVIRDDSARATREWLTEALFYVGELRLAQGDVETARRHFATVVNLRVLNFVEYGMARAELAKMREQTR